MSTERPRILFVDDEINVLKAHERLLHGSSHDWDFSFFTSVEDAMSEASNCKFDVVVTDLTMPGISGQEVVRRLNENSPDTQCIILTGTADLQVVTEVVNTLNVFRFYTKPCDFTVLVDGISAALMENASSPDREKVSGEESRNVVLDRLSTGVLQVTHRGELIYMNQAAAETIAADDGLSIGRDQFLRASSREDTGSLQEAFRQLHSNSADDAVVALAIERPSLNEALKLIMAPLEVSGADSQVDIVIFITDPDRKALPTTEMIARLFGLTPVESRLAWEMICGQRTEDIAESMGITLSSARTYLKRVMEKTGTNRQVDLMRLLLGIPQIMARKDENTR